MAKQEGLNSTSNKGDDLQVAHQSVQTMETLGKTYLDQKKKLQFQTVGKDTHAILDCGNLCSVDTWGLGLYRSVFVQKNDSRIPPHKTGVKKDQQDAKKSTW